MRRSRQVPLAYAVVFTAAVLVHGADHVRRGADHLSEGVFLLGTLGILAEVLVVLLVVARHRWAPPAAALVGAALATGYAVVHFLPDLGWFSDSFTSADHVSPLSWAAASAEVLAAAALALAGAAVWLRGGVPVQPTGPSETLRHPLVITIVVGNALLLGLSAAQR